MSSHKTVVKQSAQVLSDMLEMEIGDQDRSAFADSFLKNTIKILRQNPKQYLSYGPYWWPLKDMLIKRGFRDFGNTTQQEWVDALSYEEDALTIAACWAYSQLRIDEGNIYNYRHILDTGDGEGMEYFLGDDELALRTESEKWLNA